MQIKVNGEVPSCESKQGYACINSEWRDGDKIELSFNFSPRLVRSQAKVRCNIRRTTIFRGPLLYCLEAIDNQPDLNQIILPTQPAFEWLTDETLLPGCQALRVGVERLQSDSEQLYGESKPERQSVKATFIPYFLWANRGENEMLVWINEN